MSSVNESYLGGSVSPEVLSVIIVQWISPCLDRPRLPLLTLLIVLSIWCKPMWLLPIRVQVSIIWMVTKLKTIMSNNNLSFCSHLTVGVLACVCLVFLCFSPFLYKNVIRKSFCFWELYVNIIGEKLTFVVRQVFICHLKWWRKQWYSWITVVMLMMLMLIIPALLE